MRVLIGGASYCSDSTGTDTAAAGETQLGIPWLPHPVHAELSPGSFH